MAENDRERHEIAGLQILRAVAATLVAFHHTLEALYLSAAHSQIPVWLVTFGASGVDVFFVISGFIMVYVSFRGKTEAASPAGFLIKRATRIYPFYLICCFTLLALDQFGIVHNTAANMADIFRSLLLIPSDTRIMGISWTLSYEVYFYLIFAITLPLFSWRQSIYLTFMAILGLIILGNILPESTLTEFISDPISIEFCFGLLLAYVYFFKGQQISVSPWLSILGFALLIVGPIIVPHENTGGLPGWYRLGTWGLGAAIIVFSFLGVRSAKSSVMRFLVFLGDASYAIYLTHYFVIGIFARYLKMSIATQIPQALTIVVATVGCVIVGALAHLWVERPVLGAVRRVMLLRPAARPG